MSDEKSSGQLKDYSKDLFEVPEELLAAWNALPLDYEADITLPRAAWMHLMAAVRLSITMQANLAKLSLAVGSEDAAKIDQALSQWSEELVTASSSLNRFSGSIMVETVAKSQEANNVD